MEVSSPRSRLEVRVASPRGALFVCAAYVPHPEMISWLSVLIPAAPELTNVEINTRSLVPNAPTSGPGTPEMSMCFTYGGH
jgi:hypothetical protein